MEVTPGDNKVAGGATRDLSSVHPLPLRNRVDDIATTQPGAPTRPARALPVRVLGAVTTAFGWLMCTLATGAVAAFATMVSGLRPFLPILLLAAPLAVVLKLCGCLGRRWPGPFAALAVLLAAAYAECLVAVARIASTTGFPFGLAFRTGGLGLTLQVAELGLSALSIVVYACAAILAAAVATWMARARPGERG